MSWIRKLLGKEQSHEQWLEQHPGKESTSAPPAAVSTEEQAATRTRIEKEMKEQGDRMRNA